MANEFDFALRLACSDGVDSAIECASLQCSMLACWGVAINPAWVWDVSVTEEVQCRENSVSGGKPNCVANTASAHLPRVVDEAVASVQASASRSRISFCSISRGTRTYKRYYYCNLETGSTQWEYPELPGEDVVGAGDEMEICCTPPPPPATSPPPPPPPPQISPCRDPSPPPPPRISDHEPSSPLPPQGDGGFFCGHLEAQLKLGSDHINRVLRLAERVEEDTLQVELFKAHCGDLEKLKIDF
ncbi:hypothetical protein PR048_029744 [Dryococelus australis]|uniref:WW domain-containing protein n=1 Tax=Dryococelus australis TaxID=614101 RepID=A0ABQ9GGF6_9NEOP|nr:hypothetical protein PR048_029744 [Dryococelus australis]